MTNRYLLLFYFFVESMVSYRYRSKHIPAIAFQPHSAQGVVDALLLAKDFGMVVTVKNGGHNPAGLTREEGAPPLWNEI